MNKAMEVMNAPERLLAQLGLSEEKIEMVKALAKDVKGEMKVCTVYNKMYEEKHGEDNERMKWDDICWNYLSYGRRDGKDVKYTVHNMELEHVLYGRDEVSVSDCHTCYCDMCSVKMPSECIVPVEGVYKMHKQRPYTYKVCVACAHIGLNNPVYGDRVAGSLTGDEGKSALMVRDGEIVCVHEYFTFKTACRHLDPRFCWDYDSMPDYAEKHYDKSCDCYY